MGFRVRLRVWGAQFRVRQSEGGGTGLTTLALALPRVPGSGQRESARMARAGWGGGKARSWCAGCVGGWAGATCAAMPGQCAGRKTRNVLHHTVHFCTFEDDLVVCPKSAFRSGHQDNNSC